MIRFSIITARRISPEAAEDGWAGPLEGSSVATRAPGASYQGSVGRLRRADVAALTGARSAAPRPVLLEQIGDPIPLQVPNASSLTFIDATHLAVIDDELGVFVAGLDGRAELARGCDAHARLRDVEGICRHPSGQAVLALSEDNGKLSSLKIKDGPGLGKPKRAGEVPLLNKQSLNKGPEGLDVLPARLGPDGRDRLIVVNEGKPRRISVLLWPDLKLEAALKLDAAVKPYLEDLSDVAVDPLTGHLFLLSDQSQAIVEARLIPRLDKLGDKAVVGFRLEILQVTRLDLGPGQKAEGLTFAPDGRRLWVCTDGDTFLYQLNVRRP